MTGYQTAQYVAGPTRNNVPQQQAKNVVAPTPYNTNQTYATQTAYQQNPQANAQPKRKLKLPQQIAFPIIDTLKSADHKFKLKFYRTSNNNHI